MKKPTKRDTINLFFSAFLIIAFIVCAHFFSQYASALSQPLGSIIPILVYAVFGLLMFYATRVGDGKAVKRFSLVTLIVIVLPSIYIIVVEEETGNLVQGGIEADLADDENAEDTAFEESEEVETEELSEDESESTNETDNGEDALIIGNFKTAEE